jgi:hypothetical protein
MGIKVPLGILQPKGTHFEKVREICLIRSLVKAVNRAYIRRTKMSESFEKHEQSISETERTAARMKS